MIKTIGVTFLKFSFVGVLNAIVGAIVYYTVLFSLKTSPTTAYVLCYITGIFFSYFANKAKTFKDNTPFCVKQLTSFIIINIFACLLSLAMLSLAINCFHVSSEIAYFFAIPASLVVNFIGNFFWTFKKS
ncbi:GtrA family protein [Desulfovibrio gilichinskyi]|uniref:GtrA family protein n=1 Tax=Desulfovibrio gilichinskyi TaxID=1519643 RepID=UPI0014834316|nr:GtrA family protein [Desulfovibrio gilichinskyi]